MSMYHMADLTNGNGTVFETDDGHKYTRDTRYTRGMESGCRNNITFVEECIGCTYKLEISKYSLFLSFVFFVARLMLSKRACYY